MYGSTFYYGVSELNRRPYEEPILKSTFEDNLLRLKISFTHSTFRVTKTFYKLYTEISDVE